MPEKTLMKCGCCNQTIRSWEIGESVNFSHNTVFRTWDDRVHIHNHGLDVFVHECPKPFPIIRIALWWHKIRHGSRVDYMIKIGPESWHKSQSN